MPVEVLANYISFNGKEYICSFIRDITERKQHEARLRTFEIMAEQAPDGIAVADDAGIFTYTNPAYQQIMGYTQSLVGQPLTSVVAETDHARIPEVVHNVIDQGRWHGELQYCRQDSSVFPAQVTVFAIPSDSGDELSTAVILRDITERKHNEEQMQKLAAIVDNSPDFIGIATLEGKALYLNQAGLNLVGLKDMEAARQTNVIDFFSPEDHPFIFQEIHPTVMEQGRWEGVFRFRHYETGELIPINYNLFLVKDQQTGEPLGLATVTRDLTEQQRAEAERAALQEQVIDAQRATLRELSTPLIPISDNAVVMPLIGSIDTLRAQQIMEALLDGISAHRATVAIIDITGVQVIDTQVANALIQAAQAVKLLGARVMITGIQPQIAQTLVHLGVHLGGIDTRGTLQAGIAAVLKARR
jgi:rsbT co-antagonist protein RsbR